MFSPAGIEVNMIKFWMLVNLLLISGKISNRNLSPPLEEAVTPYQGKTWNLWRVQNICPPLLQGSGSVTLHNYNTLRNPR